MESTEQVLSDAAQRRGDTACGMAGSSWRAPGLLPLSPSPALPVDPAPHIIFSTVARISGSACVPRGLGVGGLGRGRGEGASEWKGEFARRR